MLEFNVALILACITKNDNKHRKQNTMIKITAYLQKLYC